ncbi:YihY/virulence factor BrkB family protein [Filifactor alocis]|uniref:YihY/virulence factor BrkB family protein n=1 Tax=Filifactor alocis TaxID=143361 RepID=UPI0028D2639B|nr:YihY/virulence factor BrkB family protein [Filifactor alocis]
MKMIQHIKDAMEPKPKDHVLLYSFKCLAKRYVADNLSQLGGQLAYFFILSLFPFLIAVNGILGRFDLNIKEQLGNLSHFFPDNVIYVLQQYLSHLSHSDHNKMFVMSMIIMIWMATSAIRSLLFSLNHAFRSERPLSLQKQLASFPLVVLMILFIFVSLISSSIGKNACETVLRFFKLSQDWTDVWQIIRWIIPFFGVVTIVFLLYNIIPDRNFPRKYTIIGALFSVSLWIVTSMILSFYTSNFGRYSIIYGSLGAIIIMLLFLYWSGIIIVLGGELAHILAMRSQKRFEYDVDERFL